MIIITDSSALYSPEEGKKLDLEVLPLQVAINNKCYKEFVEIQSSEFIDLVRKGYIPTSSQPPIGETIELFEKNQNEDTLVINMADGLSGTYQSTLSAKESVENNEHIHVLNSMTLCGPQRYLVQKALHLRELGYDINSILVELENSIKSTRSFLIPQDFSFLKRGGRLTPLAATIGGLLKIIPVMKTTEDGTRLEKFAVKKTMKGAIKEIIRSFHEMGVDENYIIYVSHADVLLQAQEVVHQIQKDFDNVKIELLDLSPAFITQGGPECIAVQTIRM